MKMQYIDSVVNQFSHYVMWEARRRVVLPDDGDEYPEYWTREVARAEALAIMANLINDYADICSPEQMSGEVNNLLGGGKFPTQEETASWEARVDRLRGVRFVDGSGGPKEPLELSWSDLQLKVKWRFWNRPAVWAEFSFPRNGEEKVQITFSEGYEKGGCDEIFMVAGLYGPPLKHSFGKELLQELQQLLKARGELE
jgi:hypothetical protein